MSAASTDPVMSAALGPVASVAPSEVPVTEGLIDELAELDHGWVTIVWNDPVNLMTYVTYVFKRHFGYSHEKATALMNDVHHKGKAAVSHGSREQMEKDTAAMHEYGLWATFSQD